MRIKLFLTFFAVMLTALLSILIFEHLILQDFLQYAESQRQDRVYWLMAAVEGAHSQGKWDRADLEHAMHWGAILGFDLAVTDASGAAIINTAASFAAMTPTMRRRVDSMVQIDAPPTGPFEEYPLFVEGTEVGTLRARSLQLRSQVMDRAAIFRQRERDFLFTSFLIAGGGALALSLIFSLYLTRPLKRLKAAAEDVAKGDLGVRVEGGGKDEVGRLIASFNRMVETLEREEALRKHLTSNIAHELRTPIAVLRANLEAMADGVVPLTQESMATLESEVQRLTGLVMGIEDFARAEAAFFKPSRKVELELGEFLRASASALLQLFGAKGMEMAFEGTEVRATVDDEKLEIILRNLLNNALEHAGGGKVTVSYGASGDKLFVEVADEGPGISAEAAKGIFRRFERGESSSGIGLGLSIARELAHIMGGELELVRGANKGAAFRLTLPIEQPEESGSGPAGHA